MPEVDLDLRHPQQGVGLEPGRVADHAGVDADGLARSSGALEQPAEQVLDAQRAREQAWYPGETVISGIGQGFWVASPLQLAQATASVP